jgi:hypothetical protein
MGETANEQRVNNRINDVLEKLFIEEKGWDCLKQT